MRRMGRKTHTRTTAGVAVLALAGLFAMTGCSSGGRTAAASASTAPAATADRPLDMCSSMPLAEVAAVLQAHGADTVTEQKPGAGGMCSYLHVVKPADYHTKLLIDFTRMRSADQARLAIDRHRDDFRGHAVTAVPGLGDDAFVVENEGAESLNLRVGSYQGQINLMVEDQPPASLRPAVLALGKQVLARLP